MASPRRSAATSGWPPAPGATVSTSPAFTRSCPTGRANFSPANPDFAPVLPDQMGTASITLPDIITVGVMGRPRSDLALTFDANVVLWSTFDRVDFNFQTAPDRAIVPNGRN